MSESHRLDVRRFIAQMDRSFAGNDLDTAAACLKSWEAEARALSDARGLLAVRNEA